MKAVPNNIALFYLAGMLVACLAVPLMLARYVGFWAGGMGAAAAAALWYSQYRIPARNQRAGLYFWFVAGGYSCIGVILLGCLSQLLW